jgi:hypothetical protein
MGTISNLNLLNLKIALFVLTIILAYCCRSGSGNGIKHENMIIENVIYETEEAYTKTNRGYYALPNPRTAVYMDDSTFFELVAAIKQVIGKEVTVYIDDSTIVGISSNINGVNFIPSYKKRSKIIYDIIPEKVNTILYWWDSDSYRITITTRDGTFCVLNTYEVSDYYKKVHEILKAHCEITKDYEIQVTIFYHKIDNSYECKGEVEKIEFIK